MSKCSAAIWKKILDILLKSLTNRTKYQLPKRYKINWKKAKSNQSIRSFSHQWYPSLNDLYSIYFDFLQIESEDIITKKPN